MVDLYNHMTTEGGKEIIHSGWKAAGITEALTLGTEGLESLDPFQDIDPMMEQSQPSNDCLDSICQLAESQLKIAYTPMEEDASENESEWENGDTVILIEMHLTHLMTSQMMNKQFFVSASVIIPFSQKNNLGTLLIREI